MLGFCLTLAGVWLRDQILGLIMLVLVFSGVGAVCSSASFRCNSSWPYIVALTLMCRMGEATNPGPNESNFVLGAFNPSGLKGKAPYIVSQLAQGDIWAISETHLCGQSLQQFRAGLHFAKSPHRYCISGHPVPSQHSRKFHAAWRGVAVLSKFPSREVPTNLPREIKESARTLITTTLVNDYWVTGGVVYGEPESSSYPQQKIHNEELLHHVASQVCHLTKGPRFLAGDWNCEQHSLPVFDLLEAAGFRDLQDLAFDMWGQPVAHTCKHATRKDFCYVSREMQHLLCSVSLLHDVFPDHAVLMGEFASLKKSVPRQIWVSPGELPWPLSWEVDPNFWGNSSGTAENRYHALWRHIETQACQALPFPVDPRAVGRASIHAVKKSQDGKIPPPKKARIGDVHPHYVCASFRHAQWLRQLRRLQAYMRHVAAQHQHTEYAKQLWGSILRSTGFTPSFADWWPNSGFHTLNSPARIPYAPPGLDDAQRIFDSFALAFRAFELELQQSSRMFARLKREANPNAIFQDLKDRQTKDVNVILKPVVAKVEHVNHADQALVFESPVCFDLGKPVFCNGVELEIIHAEADAAWIADVGEVTVGSTVTQLCCKGTDEELFSLFLGAWKTMWERHGEVPPERWDTILTFAREKLPRQQLHWPAIGREALSASIAHKHKHTTGGLDGVSLQDLKAMPPAALDNFLAMFHHAESTGSWPPQLVAGRVTCLAKTANPLGALDFRPITVFGLLYRCWGTYQARQAIRMLDSVLPVGLYGSRPNCYSGQVWSHMLWTIEMAYENQTDLCGIIADIQKAFNFLPRIVVLEACAILGLPFQVLCGWAGALSEMTRRFQINGSFSPTC